MELHGFTKVLDKLTEFGVEIESLTTDDHPSIKKHLKNMFERGLSRFGKTDFWQFLDRFCQ